MPRTGTADRPPQYAEAPKRWMPKQLSFSLMQQVHPAYPYACPLKMAYSRILRLPWQRTPAMAVGSALDVAANAYFELRIEGADEMAAGAKAWELGEAHLEEERLSADLFRDDRQYEAYIKLLEGAWAAFVNHEGGADALRVQDRHEFTLRMPDGAIVPIVGYSDRIDRDGTIVDLKFSGSTRWTAEGAWNEDYVSEKRDQLLTYFLARQAVERRTGTALFPPVTGRARLVVIYHKTENKKAQHRALDMALDMSQAQPLLERYAQTWQILTEQRFPARPGRPCGFCSFVTECREDHRQRGPSFWELVETPF